MDPNGARKLAFQQVERLERTTWPSHDVPMQMHLDFTVSSLKELQRQRERAEALGAQVLRDRRRVLAAATGPAGHVVITLARTPDRAGTTPAPYVAGSLA